MIIMQYSLTADYAANSQPFVTFQSGAAAQQTLEPHNHQQDHQDGNDNHDGDDYHDGGYNYHDGGYDGDIHDDDLSRL